MSVFSWALFLCGEQPAEQSSTTACELATQFRHTNATRRKTADRKRKTRANPRGVPFSNPWNRWGWGERGEVGQPNPVFRCVRSQWDPSGHHLVHSGRRHQVSYRCRLSSRRRAASLCCWVVSDFLQSLCQADCESADSWWGCFTVGWWEMFVVQHSNPSRLPEPLAVITEDIEGMWGG